MTIDDGSTAPWSLKIHSDGSFSFWMGQSSLQSNTTIYPSLVPLFKQILPILMTDHKAMVLQGKRQSLESYKKLVNQLEKELANEGPTPQG